LIQGTRHALFGDVDYLKKLIDLMEYTRVFPTAIIYEPIQGEAVVQIPLMIISLLSEKFVISMILS